MEDNPPLDDAGIVIDQIMEVCSAIVGETHNIMADSTTKTPRDLRDMAMTMDIVWNLSRDIIENDFLSHGDYDMGDPDMGDNPGGPRNYNPDDFDD